MPLAEPAHPRLGSVSKRAPPIQQKPDAPRALSAMNQRVSRFELASAGQIHRSPSVRERGHFRGGNFGSNFGFRASQSRARIPVSRKSSQRALFRFAILRVREPTISPYRNLPRLSRPSLAPLAEASASYEQTVRIALFRDGSRAAFPVMLLFRSSEKAERAPPPRRTAKRADARRVARDLIGLPEVSVGSTRARAPQARLGLRTPRAIRKASSVKFVPGDTREKTVSQTRAHRQSRVPSRTILTVRDARRDPLEPQYTRSDLSTSHVVRQRLTRETPGERAHYRRSFLFSRG